MKANLRRWWDNMVKTLEAMDSSPVSDLYVEFARLQHEVQVLAEKVEQYVGASDQSPQSVVLRIERDAGVR